MLLSKQTFVKQFGSRLVRNTISPDPKRVNNLNIKRNTVLPIDPVRNMNLAAKEIVSEPIKYISHNFNNTQSKWPGEYGQSPTL